MREIEFRGKRKLDGAWIYGGYMKTQRTNKVQVGGTSKFCTVIPETLGQYIGLKDKNGTKIFEGDIVINDFGEKFLVELGFDEKHFFPVSKLKLPHKDCRIVIGNIYDNKLEDFYE